MSVVFNKAYLKDRLLPEGLPLSHTYVYIYCHPSSDCFIQCGMTREMLQAGIETRLTLRRIFSTMTWNKVRKKVGLSFTWLIFIHSNSTDFIWVDINSSGDRPREIQSREFLFCPFFSWKCKIVLRVLNFTELKRFLIKT